MKIVDIDAINTLEDVAVYLNERGLVFRLMDHESHVHADLWTIEDPTFLASAIHPDARVAMITAIARDQYARTYE